MKVGRGGDQPGAGAQVLHDLYRYLKALLRDMWGISEVHTEWREGGNDRLKEKGRGRKEKICIGKNVREGC